MSGSYYFKALPRIFQRFIFSRSKVHARRLQTPIVSASVEPPEESSNGLRHREPPLPPSRLSGSESAESSIIPNRTATLSDFWLNRTEPGASTIAEVRRMVGR